MSPAERFPHTAAAVRLARGCWAYLTDGRPVLGGCLVLAAYILATWAALAVAHLAKGLFQ